MTTVLAWRRWYFAIIAMNRRIRGFNDDPRGRLARVINIIHCTGT
jgi:hypothetical protein